MRNTALTISKFIAALLEGSNRQGFLNHKNEHRKVNNEGCKKRKKKQKVSPTNTYTDKIGNQYVYGQIKLIN